MNRDLQLSIYALGIITRWPHVEPERLTLSLYFLKHGEKLSTKHTEREIEASKESIVRTISEIRTKVVNDERFEPTPGPYCASCSYRPICPVWKHLYKKPEAETPDDAALEAAIAEYFDVLKSDKAAAKRLSELRGLIRGAMEARGFDRVFGSEGYLTRKVQQRFGYDFDKVRAVLEPLGRWGEILDADEKKLKAIIATLPPDAKAAIEDAKILEREFTVLAASTKRVSKPKDEEDTPLPEAPVADREPDTAEEIDI